jgi:hypothetical protein
MSGADDLITQAKERAEASPLPDGWGHRIQLDPGAHFTGRWRGETTDEAHDNRRVFLFWDDDSQLCFSRFYAALGREIDSTKPNIGDTIVIVRGDDYTGAQGTGYSFGVATGPNDDPLPDDDGIPF